MMIKKLNNSFTYIEHPNLSALKEILSIEREGWQYDFEVKIGRKSKYDFYFWDYKDGIIVASGVLELDPIRDFLKLEPLSFLQDSTIVKEIDEIIDSIDLPFKCYDYQVKAIVDSLTKEICLSRMCTGSGKSVTISIILEYFRRKGLRGVLVVPNINLLTQFANDIKSYNLHDLHKGIQRAGDGIKAEEVQKDKTVLITTWQSMIKCPKEVIEDMDFIICDEVHKFSSECTSKLVLDSTKARYKFGFTGTLPKNPGKKLTIIGLFGMPNNIILSHELIEMGLGTPIEIHGLKLKYDKKTNDEISMYTEYLDKVKYITSNEKRTNIISKLCNVLKEKSKGSCLVLYNHISHGEELYKAITGLNEVPDWDTQKELGVFFMTGKTKSKDREIIRNIMNDNPKGVLVANYTLLSTGVNIKTLRYAIFAAPLKSYTSIAQSLGRGIRLSEGKDKFEVYDIIDSLTSIRTFYNSYKERKDIYAKERFKYDEKNINL